MEQEMEKRQLRQRLLGRRGALSAERREQCSRDACAHLLACERLMSADVILAYYPFRDELDILPFLEEAMRRGKEIWLPRTIPEKREMIPCRYTGKQMLAQGAYGIWEPDPTKAEAADIDRLDAVLVPGVGFDRRGGRLGYGGGYYDRFLAGLEHRPFLLGIGFAVQIVERVPMEPHDILLDGVVSEAGCLQI
jgi:5-formyltetrahydrofolate cyclo-ligase